MKENRIQNKIIKVGLLLVCLSIFQAGCAKTEIAAESRAVEESGADLAAKGQTEDPKASKIGTETAADAGLTERKDTEDTLLQTGGVYKKKAAEETNYYMKTDDFELGEADVFVPCLTLSEDGSFSFSYDILSSYYTKGTYTVKEDRLTAVTDDGKYRYEFNMDDGNLIFMQEPSSVIAPIDSQIGVPVTDGAVFALKEKVNEPQERMTAVVKEIGEGYLLVSSVTDRLPGAYYVFTGDIDISAVRGGDEIDILWNGDVLETSPAQIYADELEIR